jgi:hypothetical protein
VCFHFNVLNFFMNKIASIHDLYSLDLVYNPYI